MAAADLLPFSLSDIVERTVSNLSLDLPSGNRLNFRFGEPIILMTQRIRFDQLLIDAAIANGVEFRDGVQVLGIEMDSRGVRVRTRGGNIHCEIVVGADGANGVTARSAAVEVRMERALALEGSVRDNGVNRSDWCDTAGVILGDVPGGYGWLFPKADHFNIGVGSWRYLAATLRAHLAATVRHYGASVPPPFQIRGHHLPIYVRGSRLSRGRCILAGDAAGLVSPLTGEGIWPAILSGRIAASAAIAALSRDIEDLAQLYDYEVKSRLEARMLRYSAGSDALHLGLGLFLRTSQYSSFPSKLLGRVIGDEVYAKKLTRPAAPVGGALRFASWLAQNTALGRVAGHPGAHALKSGTYFDRK